MSERVLILIVVAVVVVVLGAGVAALVHFLTRQKNGSKNYPEDD